MNTVVWNRMIAEETDKERCKRFYRWAVQDCFRELRDDFPLMRRIQSINSIEYINLLLSLPAEERAEMAITLVRRMHRAAIVLLAEPFSEKELGLIDQFFHFGRAESNVLWQKLYRSALANKKASKRRVRAQIVEQLTPILGEPVKYQSSDLVFVTPVGNWFVGTRVEVKSPASLCYWQTVMANKDDFVGPYTVTIQKSTNICAWLGASADSFSWYISDEVEIENAAETLAVLCSHYLKNIPLVLDGLVPESTQSSNWITQLTLPSNLDGIS